jgi:hypothetical protein
MNGDGSREPNGKKLGDSILLLTANAIDLDGSEIFGLTKEKENEREELVL